MKITFENDGKQRERMIEKIIFLTELILRQTGDRRQVFCSQMGAGQMERRSVGAVIKDTPTSFQFIPS